MSRRRVCPYCADFHDVNSKTWKYHQELLKKGEKPWAKLTSEEKSTEFLGRQICKRKVS
jgi:hypothetical protein